MRLPFNNSRAAARSGSEYHCRLLGPFLFPEEANAAQQAEIASAINIQVTVDVSG
jgi:hypothetical protein